MCGIISRISLNNSAIRTLKGLKYLEYRGYDSYGILLHDLQEDKQILEKDVQVLKKDKLTKLSLFKSNIELGHTRWSTHGKPSKENAHPLCDRGKRFYVVMNGIIENYSEVKNEFTSAGIKFESQTDTELIPFLYSLYFEEDEVDDIEQLLIATKNVLSRLTGEFSYILKYKNYVLGFKNVNPLVIGKNQDEYFISSDSNLIQSNTDMYYVMEDFEIFICKIENEIINLELYQNFEKIPNITWINSIKESEVKSKHSKYFMVEEIREQKFASKVLTDSNVVVMRKLVDKLKEKDVFLFGAGSSYHSAYVMHYMLLENGIFSNVVIASELDSYLDNIRDSVIVVFSQSGETADLMFPIKHLREKGNEVFLITNTANSTLDRLSDYSVYLNCGKEIAVAATKSFSAQLFVIRVLESMLEGKDLKRKINLFERTFDMILKDNEKRINKICTKFQKSKDFYFIGRGKWYPLALEGALKLKEISYIHAEGFAGGELKHGTLALIEEGTPVIVLGEEDIISNATEIKARGGYIIGVGCKNNEIYDYFLEVPELFKEIFSTILMQILAMKMAIALGHNPDKPRNLAKSVTVR